MCLPCCSKCYISEMKRKNRLTVNFLCPSVDSKKRKKFRICKETIPLQQPVLDRVNDISNVSEAGIEFESHDVEESSDLETAHTKRKLKPADNWSGSRDSDYATMISTYALHDDAECFLCRAPATVRCIQCGTHLMCLQALIWCIIFTPLSRSMEGTSNKLLLLN